MTKGIDVARSFFEGWGLPYLQSEYPQLADRVAALVCGGSQCLGNDDELSRDHGWGPHFTLVLTGLDMRRFGRGMATRTNSDAPREWNGYALRGGSSTRSVEVAGINRWFRELVRCERPPHTEKGWYHKTREDNLCMLRKATVFHDPLGEWTARRASFHYFPARVRAWRARDELYNIWHFGQYNFLDRLTRRRDPVAIALALGRFSEGVMRLSLVLAREYCPYWKWLAAEFRKLPEVAELDQWLRQLAASVDIDEQADLVRSICADMYPRVAKEFDLAVEPGFGLMRLRDQISSRYN